MDIRAADGARQPPAWTGANSPAIEFSNSLAREFSMTLGVADRSLEEGWLISRRRPRN
jgi:hypothetical protein